MYLIRERFFRLGEDSDITDEHDRPVLHVDGKVLTLHDRLVLRDPEGNEVAQVHRKLVSLRPSYKVTVGVMTYGGWLTADEASELKTLAGAL